MNRDEGFGRRQILNVRGVCGYFVDLGILGIKWTWFLPFMNVSMLRVKGIPFVRMRNGYTGLIEKKKKIVFEVETEIEELIWKLSNWKLYNLKMYDDKYKFWIVILEGRSNIYKKEKFWLRLYEIIFVDACANNLEINSLCSFHKYHYKFSILLYVIQRKIILIFRFNNWSPNLSVNYCILYLTHFF